MAVFPESMGRIDVDDPRGAIRVIDSYIRYMQERIEFANRQTTRTVTEAGIASVGLYEDLVTLRNTVQALASTINAALAAIAQDQLAISALDGEVEDLGGRVDTLDGEVDVLGGRVDALDGEMDALGGQLLQAVYPVGSLYLSASEASPATLFGFGTWVQIKDKFLLASGDTYEAGATGGEAEHTLTTAEMPTHSHGLKADGINATYSWGWGDNLGTVTIPGTSAVAGQSSANGLFTYQNVYNSTDNTGGGGAHNNMPPYLAVYVWQRTA